MAIAACEQLREGVIYELKDSCYNRGCQAIDIRSKYIRIVSFQGNGKIEDYEILDSDLRVIGKCNRCVELMDVGEEYNQSKKSGMENIISAFKNLTVGEPQKTFRELGITDENDLVTSDGSRIFLSWMLADKDMAAKFKKEVADGLKQEKDRREGKK